MFSTFVSVVDLDDVINLEIDIENFCGSEYIRRK